MSASGDRPITGVLLAAGAGRRMGGPKALVRAADGTPWLRVGVETLLAACGDVVVVLGCQAQDAQSLVPDDPRVRVVVANDWAAGMGASLRAGLRELLQADPGPAALVHLVDLPDTHGGVATAVVAGAPAPLAGALARATFAGAPGHPVLLGRDHWAPLVAWLDEAGDAGARGYLAARDVVSIECGHLASGRDIDAPS